MTPRPLAVGILISTIGSSAGAEVNLDIYADVDYSLRVQSDTTNQFAVPKMSLLYTQTYGKSSASKLSRLAAELQAKVGLFDTGQAVARANDDVRPTPLAA